MLTPHEIATAFSGHRFEDVYDQLADEVIWAVPGQEGLMGRSAVIAACRETLSALAGTETTSLRFLVVAGPDAAAADSVTRYTDPDGSVSVVSSSDFYEIRDGQVVGITSYAIELDPAGIGPTSYLGAPR